MSRTCDPESFWASGKALIRDELESVTFFFQIFFDF